MNNKYYTTTYKNLADTIVFLTGCSYMVFDDKRNINNKIYSFRNNDKVLKAVEIANEIKEQIKLI